MMPTTGGSIWSWCSRLDQSPLELLLESRHALRHHTFVPLFSSLGLRLQVDINASKGPLAHQPRLPLMSTGINAHQSWRPAILAPSACVPGPNA
eukprot:647779-Amphidinium_carterae.1